MYLVRPLTFAAAMLWRKSTLLVDRALIDRYQAKVASNVAVRVTSAEAIKYGTESWNSCACTSAQLARNALPKNHTTHSTTSTESAGLSRRRKRDMAGEANVKSGLVRRKR